MKIAHIGLASHFTEKMTYQDNYLTEQNVKDGHEVLYVSDAAKYLDGKLTSAGYEDVLLDSGVRLVRLPYESVIHPFVSEKIRRVKGLYALLCDFSPDVILCHGLCFQSVTDVIRYKKEHPDVKLYADTHADYGNSGTNFLSLKLLHGVYYRSLAQKALPYLEKLLYTSYERKDFAEEVYGYPESICEFYPLGGIVPTDAEYSEKRGRRRRELNVRDNELLFLHSGKLDPGKKTEELLRAFAKAPELNAKLIIAGSIPEDRKDALSPLIQEDGRVEYLGWCSACELTEYLCAADVYLQPGTVSATMENAMCCRCAQLLYPTSSYLRAYPEDMAVWVKSEEDISQAFRDFAEGKLSVEDMRDSAFAYARERLDYQKLAARLYV